MGKKSTPKLKDIILKVLKEEKRPLTAREIWDVAIKKGYDEQVTTAGQRPWSSVQREIREDTTGIFMIIPSKPETYYLNQQMTFKGEVKKLIEFIRENPPVDPEDDDGYFLTDDWKRLLDQETPDWRNIVRNKRNWPKIEGVISRGYYENLCKAILRVAGAELAIRWFRSDVPEQRETAREYLNDPDNLDARTWKKLDEDMKVTIVYDVFESYPGEPLESISHSYRNILRRNPKGFGCTIPLFGYIPSKEIRRLQRVVEDAGDYDWEEEIEDMITERNDAVITSFFLREPATKLIPYEPSSDERDLIAVLLEKFKSKGFSYARLPEIFVSLEPPPLFSSAASDVYKRQVLCLP